MATRIIKKEEQAFGSFNNGAILENKPIGFPQDRGIVKPYSNLFYWANAWSDNGGLIGEHPHKWFEILSFVLDGEIEHYDNKYKRWLKLGKGDIQIIRAGNGITHAEKILPNSRMFQIWFDPNIAITQNKPASYNDYNSNEFNTKQVGNIGITNYTGNGGKLEMDSKGVIINKLTIAAGKHELSINSNGILSVYVLNANGLIINGEKAVADDFIIIENEKEMSISAENDVELFTIETPSKLDYLTYREMVKF
jgi:redox-sensitive bicupin YhaK (pirin superfamily)